MLLLATAWIKKEQLENGKVPILLGKRNFSLKISHTLMWHTECAPDTYGASHLALVVKSQPASAEYMRDVGWVTESGRSPGGGHGNHSRILARRIPWTEEPGGLHSIGLQSVRHY